MQTTLIKYKTLPTWTSQTLPNAFRQKHNTKEGTWAKLTILSGQLKYYALSPAGEIEATHVFSPDNPAPFVQPQAWHKVEPLSDDLQCFLEFHCQPERYYEKKYRLTAPHSEVLEVLQYRDTGDVLDLGSGRGRNSIFLRTKGFNVTALDHSETAINTLNEIIAAEPACQGIEAAVYDIQTATIERDYDLIICTVVLQFLRADSIPAVIANMQQCTRPGGINLIVAPIACAEYPDTMNWPFTFKSNELKNYYDGWRIHKYNENLGNFHRTDASGKPHQAKFATLVAQKETSADL